ncbi:ketopantoate reductase family protein [Nocardioides sp. B-3]|nr:ketopantoate reductase family protein [Nocardioides sp. B-3]UUZ57873.1 ketopantoate reductase family protein [Nocardioides sp. B-3]
MSLVARGEHLAAIREGGLRLDTATGMHRIVAPATDSAAELEWTPDTVVVLAVKSHPGGDGAGRPACARATGHPHRVRDQRHRLRDRRTAAVPRVYGMCVMLPATHLQPGEVIAKCAPTPGILDVGRIPGGTDDVTRAVSTDPGAAGFESEERSDIMAWKRRKLLLNPGNGVDASFRKGDAAEELAQRAVDEGVQVLEASGLSVVPAADDTLRRGSILRRRDDLPARGRVHTAEPAARDRRQRGRLPPWRDRPAGSPPRHPHPRQRGHRGGDARPHCERRHAAQPRCTDGSRRARAEMTTGPPLLPGMAGLSRRRC